MNADQLNTIVLTWENNFGNSHEDISKSNPLSRSLNRLFEDGQPFKRFTQCFLTQNSIDEGIENYKLSWFGVFILSHGNRVIFFPGLRETKETVQLYRADSLKWIKEFDVDHLSLERDHIHWHITSQMSKSHLPVNFPTSDLGDGRRLWFGMSISDISALWPLSQKTSVIIKSPATDVNRRVSVFKTAREGATFHILEPHPDAVKMFKRSFLHASVIVGPAGFEIYKGENHGFPAGSPFLVEPLPEEILRYPIRHHKVSLDSDVELQITIFRLPGALRVPVIFSSNS